LLHFQMTIACSPARIFYYLACSNCV
jgi:hypothetical protein